MRQPVPFGKYLLLDRISVGGMAEVFKAKSYGVEGFEKIIAIKRILPTMGEDRDFIKMFIDEAKIAGQLAHANICQIFELGRIDGSHFIAMEYIWGKDLLQIQNRLRKLKQPMPTAMACFSIAKVLEGLDYAHRKRDPLGRPLEIVHRDCSPQNVLVSYEGEVKVIDFGIAKATSRNSRTMAGVLKGKFGYMSPEQVRGLPLDRRSDIFALGTMLYECLTGERLFQGETDFSTLEKVRNVDISRPRDINPAIPESVERVILKALAKDVEDRYQWCSEMLADLQQYLMSQEVVFTAKSLSGWLKDVFSAEIERERQQLEQYKRVGRDGLIAGVPAAEAKLDVVETLGAAGAPEGDATVLGEPTFDDSEMDAAEAVGAAPQVGPPPGAPPRGTVPAPPGGDDHEDFGEEAPTEIFGEIDGGAPPPLAAAAARPAAGAPPPGPPRAGASRTPAPAINGAGGGMPPPGAVGAPLRAGGTPGPELGFQPSSASPASGYPGIAGPAHGTPGPSPAHPLPSQPLNAPAPPSSGGQAKTLLGAVAPAGLPNYANYQPPVSAQQPAAYPSFQQAGMNPSQPMMSSMPPMQSLPGVGPATGMPPGHAPPMPGQPSVLGGGASAQQQPMYPSASGQPPYGQGQGAFAAGPAPSIDAPGSSESRRRSSIVRDVAIGVAIAGVVLGGFLIIKFVVLGSGDEPPPAAALADLQISLPGNAPADLYVDNERHASVSDSMKIQLSAGAHEVKLVGPNNQQCKQSITLVAGQVTTIECNLQGQGSAGSAGAPDSAGSAGSAGSAAGSAGSAAAGSGTGSSAGAMAAGSDGAGSGSAGSADDKAAAEKAAADKAAADKAAADKAAADKAAADRAADRAADKAAADKAAAEKARLAAAERAAAEKAKLASDKIKKPPEDAAAKGWVQLTSKPPAKILVDGTDTNLTTPITGRALALPAGKHRITFQIGGDKYTFVVTVKAGETTALDKLLQ